MVSTDSRIGAGYLKACPGIGGGTLLHNMRMLVYLCHYMRLHDVADYWNQAGVVGGVARRQLRGDGRRACSPRLLYWVGGGMVCVWGMGGMRLGGVGVGRR